MQRSTISAAEISRCGIFASVTHLRISSSTAGSCIARRCSSYLYPGARFLAEAPKLAQIIFNDRLTNARLFQMTIFFADAPADIEAREIASGERSHGHAEICERFIHGSNAGAFFHEELRFTAIRTEHAIAHKAAAIADEHADFADRF